MSYINIYSYVMPIIQVDIICMYLWLFIYKLYLELVAKCFGVCIILMLTFLHRVKYMYMFKFNDFPRFFIYCSSH